MAKARIAVAMSGGVDSSMAAAFLLEQGHEVFGLTMDLGIEGGKDPRQDAAAVADFLGIAHYNLDLRQEFRQQVIEYFLAEYQGGRTPSPCVVCNPVIKFGCLLEQAKTLGAELLATGHYVRKGQEGQEIFLIKGMDPSKDQSYFLSRLTPPQIASSVFPLGGLCKTDIRLEALERKIPVAAKTDSQEICFIPDDDYRNALRNWRNSPTGFSRGDFVDEAGKLLGRHQGFVNYTIGQRKGLGLALGFPAYVLDILPESNQVVIGGGESLLTQQALVRSCVWNLPGDLAKEDSFSCQVKIRSAAKPVICHCQKIQDDQVQLRFVQPVRAVTPGQAAAFYLEDRLIGGGFFAKMCRTEQI